MLSLAGGLSGRGVLRLPEQPAGVKQDDTADDQINAEEH
jgi:hypothetical protein